MVGAVGHDCCLSSCSYIKPQLSRSSRVAKYVVYHLVPTSNHNHRLNPNPSPSVVYHLVPTSNHNVDFDAGDDVGLFIILFLHQTTTPEREGCWLYRCLSSCSYIKPQHRAHKRLIIQSCLSSCSYIKPQPGFGNWPGKFVVYHLVPTSNHNVTLQRRIYKLVVYHLVPTSNHNQDLGTSQENSLFIILFLHQTTTQRVASCRAQRLFIILFLHQTTTYSYKSTDNQ